MLNFHFIRLRNKYVYLYDSVFMWDYFEQLPGPKQKDTKRNDVATLFHTEI